MARTKKLSDIPAIPTDGETWIEEHIGELKEQYVLGQRLLYQSLTLAFVVGLAAHIGGYLLQSPISNGLQGLSADLLYALGWSLWTGVVVAFFVQVFPEVKRRQIKEAIEAFETMQKAKQRRRSRKSHRRTRG